MDIVGRTEAIESLLFAGEKNIDRVDSVSDVRDRLGTCVSKFAALPD